MFDVIGDMPLHALVIHVVVIAIPLATLLAVLFALPRTRNWARWAMALVTVGALASAFVARASGPSLKAALKIELGNPVGDLIAVHAQLATQLVIIMVVFAVLAVVNAFVVTRRSADSTSGRRAVDIILPIALVAVAILAAIWVFRVGDIGARAVWNPTGQTDYTSQGG